MTTKTLTLPEKSARTASWRYRKPQRHLKPSDELVITCDHPSAATTTIPQFAQDTGMAIESKKISPGLWEIRLTKK